jgi:putative GTP pyrophosphokinase
LPIVGDFAAGYSRSAIDRAGLVIRDAILRRDQDSEDLQSALGTLIVFRETFQRPLDKTVMGLRSMVSSESPDLKRLGGRIPVAQRLKREEQIILKLIRLPDTRLSNMGDIGGCRAVLADRSRVDGVIKRIKKNWDVHGRIRDTRDEPAKSGYRAVHVIVIRDGRRIEIQLRTPREHEWAVAVERTGTRLGIGLKEGQGPDDLKEYFRLAGQGLYLESQGVQPDPVFQREFEASRNRVRHYFQR